MLPIRDVAALVFLTCLASAQDTPGALQKAMTGTWVGTLEYRDFSEPAASTKRVKLPAWLTVEAKGNDLLFHYIYDDGPSKVVTEDSVVRIDTNAATYAVSDKADKPGDTYAITGLGQLREGRGTLTLTGPGTENDAKVEVRTTLKIGRNIIEITRETRANGQPYAFRHSYTFVRAAVPRT